jgi:phosphate transport system substrate-binding protein
MRKLLLGVLLGAVLAGSGAGRAETLSGSGSTFVKPLLDKWAKAYEKEKKDTVKYAGTGTGKGVTAFAKKSVDFACADAPVSDKALAKLKLSAKDVVRAPLVLGGVVPVVNVPGVDSRPRFTGAVLADIYLGKVKKWNDPALAKLNPGVKLPDRDIVVVRRKDSSGTTFIWTAYLARASKEAAKKIGVTTLPKWTIGVAVAGNVAMVTEVDKTPGAIGYTTAAYGGTMEKKKKVKVGLVRNRAGTFVLGTASAVSAAAEGLKAIPADTAFWLTDRPGEKAYPIVGAVWVLAHANQKDKTKARALAAFLTWAVGDGQKYAAPLGFAPLPKALAAEAEKRIGSISAK